MRTQPGVLRSIGLLLVAVTTPCLFAASARAAAPTIDPPLLPAAGRQTAVVTIAVPGRYAITSVSGTGTAIQLIDRQAGPGDIAGIAGARDGRLDLLLDRGTYRLVTRGAAEAAGEARLAVQAFREVGGTQPPLLIEGKPVGTTLGDLEQRSWWLKLDTARRVVLEAAGRNLTDLRLFRDGGWLVDAAPLQETIEPETGRPLRSCRIAARLEPGLYLLTAFGGPDEAWPAGGKEHPLHLRFGIPTLGEAGRARYRVGPFGADHFLLPGAANFVQLELPEATAAQLAEAPLPADGDPFSEAGSSAEITKKSREPVAVLEPEPQTEPRLITVRAAAGQPYVLQHFERRDRSSIKRSGRFWLGSVHSGHPQDAADATAIVTSSAAARRGNEPFLSQTIEIDPAHGWARRGNLLDPLTVFFRVREAGTYEVLLRGTAARARFEPFLVTRPQNYREPALKPGGGTWKLDPGWHVLTIVPDEPGIVDAAVRAVGRLDAIWDLLDSKRAMRGEPVRAAVTFPAVDLDWTNTYTVHLNARPGVRSGLILRELPIDLAQPLPLALRPGEEIAVDARVAEPGTIRAESEAGESLEIRSGAGRWLKALTTPAGTLKLRVRNPAAATALASLRFDATRLRADTPLPTLPPAALLPPPAFPQIAEDSPRFFDLERGGSATFAVSTATAAFHTLESTGLLETAGTLRSRFIPSLAGAVGGGTGRNFLVGAYLREGEYQLTVAAQGASRGHLGVQLRRAELRDGGSLREGTPSRVSVGPAEGTLHAFEIVEAGIYRLVATSLGRALPCRLEDADGWPIETPGIEARFERVFEPGHYRLLLLPEAVGSRRVTLLERVAQPRKFDGHGPHVLALDVTAAHTWVEPAEGADRTPDRWEFALPAPVSLSVALTGEMQGEILPRAGGEPLAKIQPGRTWSGRLPAGAYTLAAVSSRRNNQAPYEITIRAEELVAGTARAATVPASIPVSVGESGLFEFTTAGDADVKARLVDAAGAEIAEQEDRPDDWNVQLSARLEPGTYRLELAPTAAESAVTRVAMRAIAERAEPALALPASLEVRPGDDVAVIPLVVPPSAALLLLQAGAEESVGIALDLAASSGWTTLWSGIGRSHSLELPLAPYLPDQPAPRYRLRLWSLDRRGPAIKLAAVAVNPPRISERDLAHGIIIPASRGVDGPTAIAEITLDRPGFFQLTDAGAWRTSGASLQPLAPTGGAPVAATETTLRVAAGRGDAGLRGLRFALGPGQSLAVDLPRDGAAVACDIQRRGDGPALLTATAPAGQPGVAIVPRDRVGRDTPPATDATATSADEAGTATTMAVAAGPAMALLWQADPARPAARTTLRLFEFTGSPEEPLPAGPGSGTIAALASQRLTLPPGDKRLRLVLGPGLAAALVHDGAVESVRDAGTALLEETVETAAAELLIVNAGSTPAPWSIEVLPLATRDRTPAVTPAAPYIVRHAAAGTARIAIAPDAGGDSPLRLLVAGAGRLPTYLAADGRILTGTDLDVGSGGTLLLPHGPGIAAVWVQRPGGKDSGIWGGAPAPGERTVGAAEILHLDTASVGLTAKVDRPSVLHLRVDDPLVGVVHRSGEAIADFVQLRADAIDIYLPAGATTIWLRPAAGGDLRGDAEVLISPVTAIGEGPGPEILLAPAAARFFSFSVEREGPVGIGVRASPDTVSCRLLDAAGRTIGEGVVQMPTLAPGTYLLAVRAPADGGPVIVHPAIAGIVPLGSGPPDEIVRRYLGLESGEVEETGSAAPAPEPQEPEGE